MGCVHLFDGATGEHMIVLYALAFVLCLWLMVVLHDKARKYEDQGRIALTSVFGCLTGVMFVLSITMAFLLYEKL